MKKITGLSDKIFKAIMYRNSEILMSVLGSIFDKKITKIEYLSPELPVKKFVEKGKRLDLYLEEKNSYIDIEITKDYNIYIVNRNLGYGFQIYLDSDGSRRYHSGWNQDYAYFVNNYVPWILRGGETDMGVSTGVFVFFYG